MGANSKIGWTDATWNVAIGCDKVSEECKFCYMMRDMGGRWNKDVNGVVTRTKPSTFRKPLSWQRQGMKSRNGRKLKVFVSSLTDLFHPEIDSYRDEVWEIIRSCPDLVFQILTKRPERIADNLPEDWGDSGYENVWLGTSIGMQKHLHRMVTLSEIPAKNRFISAEPLIGSICFVSEGEAFSKIDWVIVGGESGNESGLYTYRPCRNIWIQGVMADCLIQKKPIFMKQLGTYLSKKHSLKSRHGTDIEEWPEEIIGTSWANQNLKAFPESYV